MKIQHFSFNTIPSDIRSINRQQHVFMSSKAVTKHPFKMYVIYHLMTKMKNYQSKWTSMHGECCQWQGAEALISSLLTENTTLTSVGKRNAGMHGHLALDF